MDYGEIIKRRLREEEGLRINPVRKKFKVALIYPNTYKVGMANLGYQFVLYELTKAKNLSVERVFLPDFGRQVLSLETGSPLKDFDVLIFSFQTEFDYINFFKILDMAQIEVFKERRDKLVLAGGISVSYNPLVLSPFIDAFFLGEAETGVLKYLDEVLSESKEETLQALCQNPYVFVPSLKERAKVGRVFELKSETHTHIFNHSYYFGDMFLLELSRGCESRCRFCIAGYFVKPFRAKPLEVVEESLKFGRIFRDRVGLIGADVSNYPYMEGLKELLRDLNFKASFSSLRPFYDNDPLFEILEFSGQKTITLAPETGSERLRFLINKTHKDEEYFLFIRRATEVGIRNVRLYFLIGLPEEREEDILSIGDFVGEILKVKGISQVHLSVNFLVPKPFTPYQYFSILPRRELKERERLLKKVVKKLGKRVRLELEPLNNCLLETTLSLGDEKVGIMLYKYHRGETSLKEIRDYAYNLKDLKFLKVVDASLKEPYLRANYYMTLKGKVMGDCKDGCRICGICKSPYVSSRSLKLTLKKL